MRGAVHFVALLLVSVALVVAIAFLTGASRITATLAFFAGIGVTIAASIYVNTRNANLYGRQVWEAQGGEMDGVARHADHMRLDRVRRHPEAAVTFPAGDVA